MWVYNTGTCLCRTPVWGQGAIFVVLSKLLPHLDVTCQIACLVATVPVAMIPLTEFPGRKHTSFDQESTRRRAYTEDNFTCVQNCVDRVDTTCIVGELHVSLIHHNNINRLRIYEQITKFERRRALQQREIIVACESRRAVRLLIVITAG
jgi:hypothetical protein